MTEPPAEAPGPTRPQQLRRSRSDRLISGVCGGIAAYFAVDPVVIRIAWVLLGVVTGGAAVIGYIIAIFVMPEESEGEAAMRASTPREGGDQSRFILGAVLVIAGMAWLFGTLIGDFFTFRPLLALVLVGIGVVLVMQGSRC